MNQWVGREPIDDILSHFLSMDGNAFPHGMNLAVGPKYAIVAQRSSDEVLGSGSNENNSSKKAWM
jgi:hypothetical protein